MTLYSPTKDNNPVWFITGCSSGFGKSLSKALSQQGIRLVATARETKSLDYLSDNDDNVLCLRLDITDRKSIDDAVQAAMNRFGQIDVIVNNAGIGVVGPVEDVTEEQTRLQFEVNVFGLFNVIRATTPIFRDQRRGMYINFSSMAGIASIDSLGVYSATKFAIEGISDALINELSPYNVRIMVIEPGPFDTEWLGKNAVWAPRNDDRYPNVWQFVDYMKDMYADSEVVGNPDLAAEIIIDMAYRPDAPIRVPLHDFSIQASKNKIKKISEDLARADAYGNKVHYGSKVEGSNAEKLVFRPPSLV